VSAGTVCHIFGNALLIAAACMSCLAASTCVIGVSACKTVNMSGLFVICWDCSCAACCRPAAGLSRSSLMSG
jgi:hypothetical protein